MEIPRPWTVTQTIRMLIRLTDGERFSFLYTVGIFFRRFSLNRPHGLKTLTVFYGPLTSVIQQRKSLRS